MNDCNKHNIVRIHGIFRVTSNKENNMNYNNSQINYTMQLIKFEYFIPIFRKYNSNQQIGKHFPLNFNNFFVIV